MPTFDSGKLIYVNTSDIRLCGRYLQIIIPLPPSKSVTEEQLQQHNVPVIKKYSTSYAHMLLNL